MNFEQLQRRVERAETLVEGRLDRVQCQWNGLVHAWKQGWTPTRIVVAGLVSGFLAGRAEPMKAMNGTRWLQTITSISGLVASLQANFAARQAETAAESAEEAATDAAPMDAAAQAHAVAAADADVEAAAPRPAEAATELSER
ncbi:protein sip-5 [Pseudoxanthomonas mexicana]|uniref:protein sip-5 n=1 Tax=Pseudoxanthomonas mexicana TaxID=128785 RepID=UPI00398B6CDE